MIRFKKISIKNFSSIGDNITEIDLDSSHTTLIKGENGAGKSTILDALCYCLYNKTPRDVKISQLVNSINKKKSLVTVDMEINGSKISVTRGQKPAIFNISVDGDELDKEHSTKETQLILEKTYLKCDFKTFLQVVIVSSTGYTNFMELSTSERRVMVERMLDLDIISTMNILVKDRVKISKSDNDRLNMDKYRLDDKIYNVKRLIENVSTSNDSIIEDLDKEMSNINIDIDNYKQQLEDTKADKPDLDIDELRSQYKDIDNKKNKLYEMVYKTENDINNKKRDGSSINKNRQFYVDNDNCNTCGQHIDETFKNDIINKYKGELITIRDEIIELKKDSEKYDTFKLKINDKLKTINNKIDLVREWKYTIDNISNKINSLNSNILSLQDKKMKISTNDNDKKMEYMKELDGLNDNMRTIINDKAEITENLENLNVCLDLLKDNGLKAKIINDYIPLINENINRYLDIMNASYSFTLDNSFNEKILSRYRDNFTYGSFSNGERQRINLAILFMWRELAKSKNTISSNLLFLDEVLDGSLDREGIESIFNIFNEMGDSNLFIISHRKEIEDNFDSIINVSKRGNFSYYEKI